MIKGVEYNTVEGLVIRLDHGISISPRKSKHVFNLQSHSRYGISNQHFNSWANFTIAKRQSGPGSKALQFSGGKRISQFNQENPIDAVTNEFYTLFLKRNHMKLYENWFGGVRHRGKLENGFSWNVSAVYEDRIPLKNTTDYSFFKKDFNKSIGTGNIVVELFSVAISLRVCR